MSEKMINIDTEVVEDFGSEWSRFNQGSLSARDQMEMFESYFHIFPWEILLSDAIGVDIGCGSGRWAALLAPRVGHLHLIDPSKEALAVARKNLSNSKNVSFYQVSADGLPFKKESLDFAYSLGVLHHVPDTARAIDSIARILKPGAPFLIYLYYALDNRPLWFRLVWKFSDILRGFISKLPKALKNIVCELIAFSIYLPLARIALLLEWLRMLPCSWPLAYYRRSKLYVMRTDALDRFGTRLEKRFSRQEIKVMLERAGFADIRFSDKPPFWCAVGVKKAGFPPFPHLRDPVFEARE